MYRKSPGKRLVCILLDDDYNDVDHNSHSHSLDN